MTPKQQRFVEEYLIDLNATQAATRAGYSPKTANEQGARLLVNASVAAAIQEAQQRRSARTEVTADRVIKELARIGFSDLRALFDANGNLIPMTDLPVDVSTAIASVEVLKEKTTRYGGDKEGGYKVEEATVKFRAWDKTKALELIARHLGMLKDRVQLEGIPTFRLVRDDSGHE